MRQTGETTVWQNADGGLESYQRNKTETDRQRDDEEVMTVTLEVHIGKDWGLGRRHHNEHDDTSPTKHEQRNRSD